MTDSNLDELDWAAIGRLCKPFDDVIERNPFAQTYRIHLAAAFIEGLDFIGDKRPETIAFEIGAGMVRSIDAVDDGARGLRQIICERSEYSRHSAESLVHALFERAAQKFGYAPEERDDPPLKIVRLRRLGVKGPNGVG